MADAFDRIAGAPQTKATSAPAGPGRGGGDAFDRVAATPKYNEKSDEEVVNKLGGDFSQIRKSSTYRPGELSELYHAPADDLAKNPMFSKIASLGKGAFNVGMAGLQGLEYAANAAGILGDEDYNYAKMRHSAFNANYDRNNEKNPITETVGSIVVPVPGAATGSAARTVQGMARTGAAAGAMQPVDETSKDGFASQKLNQVATGAILGPVFGKAVEGVVKGVTKLAGKFQNYASTLLPEELAAKLNLQADEAGVAATKAAETAQGRIMQDKLDHERVVDAAAAELEKARAAAQRAKDGLQSGVTGASKKFADAKLALKTAEEKVSKLSEEAARRAQDAAEGAVHTLGTSASMASSTLRSAMGNTAFHGTDDLLAASKGGDGRASQVLDQVLTAQKSNNPDLIQRASIQLQNWNTRQQATKLYDEVSDLAESLDLGPVNPENTRAFVKEALRTMKTDKFPADSGLEDILKTAQSKLSGRKLAPGFTGAMVEIPVDNSYANMRAYESALGAEIRGMQKGAKSMIGDRSLPMLTQLREAVREDLTKYAQSHPELAKAEAAANAYYKQTRVPFKAPDIAKAGSELDADKIYGQIMGSKSADQAQRYYNVLDPKGRVAVRYRGVQDAFNGATDPATGSLNPKKFFDYLDELEKTQPAFFSGADGAELRGIRNIAGQAILLGDEAKKASTMFSVSSDAASRVAATEAELAAAKDRLAKLGVTSGQMIDMLDNALKDRVADSASRLEAAAVQHTAQGDNIARAAKASESSLREQAKAKMKEVPKSMTAAGLMSLAGLTGGAEVAAVMSHSPLAAAGGGIVAAAALMKMLARTDAGRRYALAASKLEPGSPAMATLIRAMENNLPVSVGRVAATASARPSRSRQEE